MARHASTYRPARRNAARGQPWPGVRTKTYELPAVRPNKRDRSVKRKDTPTMDFTGYAGLINGFVQHNPRLLAQPKPKRGWAAARRRAPFADAFAPERMAKIAARHVHPRSLRSA